MLYIDKRVVEPPRRLRGKPAVVLPADSPRSVGVITKKSTSPLFPGAGGRGYK